MTAALSEPMNGNSGSKSGGRPRLGDEQTKTQAKAGFGLMGAMPGLGPVSPGTYDTYRKMRADPTVALARSVVRSPIESNKWTFEAKDDAPDGALELIQEQMQSMRPIVIKAMLDAMDLGWAGFEKVFEVRAWSPPEGGQAKPVLWLKKLKPLLQDITEILADKADGRFMGFKQKDTEIGVDNALLYTFDREGDNHYGRARLENVRNVWAWWEDANKGAAKYDNKIAGVFPHVTFPPGKGQGATGNEEDNFELAKRMVSAIQAGNGIVTPKIASAYADEEDLNDPKAQAWTVTLLEDRGSRQPGFIERLRYLDTLKMRGYLRPERVALEGQFGTKAEAGVHADIAILDGELIDQDIARVINWHVVDQLMALNFGEDARGTVYITPAPLQDELKALYVELVKALMGQPAGLELLLDWLDWDAIIDSLGIQKAREVVGQIEGVEHQVNGPDGPTPLTDAARSAMERAMQQEQQQQQNRPPTPPTPPKA